MSQEKYSAVMAETVMQSPPLYDGRWCYENGLMLLALEKAGLANGDRRCLDFVEREISRYIRPDGSIETYRPEECNIDNILEGRVLFGLYDRTGDRRYRLAMEQLMNQLKIHPRTKEGGFWHKRIYPHQMWLDGIYMGAPFYAEYSRRFGSTEDLDDAIRQPLLMVAHARDERSGLLYHGWDESHEQRWANPVTGCSPCFWGRAMGWYTMALVDLLDVLPDGHAKRAELIELLRSVVQAVSQVRDEESGLWLQVLDGAGRPGNYPEASASAMFIYALAKVARLGYVESSYATNARDAFNKLISLYIDRGPDGLLRLSGICRVAGLGGNPYRDGSYDYYISAEVIDNDYKGTGPFILAALEIEAMEA